MTHDRLDEAKEKFRKRGRKLKMTPERKEKIHKVMHEFKMGKLYSGSGKKVMSREQAIAIALNQAREL